MDTSHSFELIQYKSIGNNMLKIDRMCTYGEFYDALVDYLKQTNMPGTIEFEPGDLSKAYDWIDYISADQPIYKCKDKNIPNFSWLYCWVVPGGSEGHYFHIDCYDFVNRKTVNLFILKTLSGNIDKALFINNAICKFILEKLCEC